MNWHPNINKIPKRCFCRKCNLLGVCIIAFSSLWMSCSQNPNSTNVSHQKVIEDSSLIIDEFRSKYESQEYLCLISYSNECPIAKNYIKTIKTLFQAYGKQVAFCLLDPGVGSKPISGMEEILFRDHSLLICKRYNIQVYPQAVLVNCLDRKVLYTGKIDDRAIALGEVKSSAEKHYLQDALKQLVTTGRVAVESNQAVGCFVGDLTLKQTE